jgi:REP element-mobilizing transposase RayT/CheY-like chemotaxis protein
LEAALTNYREGFIQIPKYPQGKSSILVVTPLTDLGELICESLKEVSICEQFSSASKTISYLRQHQESKQAILDMEMGEMRLLDLGRALRRINPTIEIIIISKEEPSTDLEAIQPWKFLRKPLLLHDLQVALGIETDEEVIPSSIIDLNAEKGGQRAPLYWINDPALATRQLARMIEKSSAQEALLIQNNALWSYTGQLSEDSVQEVDHLISKSWDGKNQADLMRFIKLETTQTEHALYATLVAMGVILALVFDSEIPFSIVRTQTNELANTLLLPDEENEQVKALSWGDEDGKEKIEERSISSKQFNKSPFIPRQEDVEIGSSSDIFNAFVNTHLTNQPFTGKVDLTPNTDLLGDLKIHQATEKLMQSVHDYGGMKEDTTLNYGQSEENHASIHLEPVSDGMYNLTYSCLLIPRFCSHRLTRDRENLVIDCMKEIYTSYGWRLEFLEAKPDYLRWVASIPPTIALSEHIEIIRKETSKRLFDDFPPYRQENLSSDYWAPGYLIMGGKNALSDQLIMAYTKQNRQKYGLWKG